MIYIEPCGGLGNRMRAFESAIRLAQYRKTYVTVFWKVNGELHAPLDALFEPFPKEARIKLIFNRPEGQYLNEYYDRHFTGRIKKYFKPLLIDNPEWDDCVPGKAYFKIFYDFMDGKPGYDAAFEQYSKDQWDSLWPKKSYYLRSYSRFFGDDMSTYEYFKPLPEILTRANKLLQQMGSNTCGVHIRRTDQLKAIEISTTDKYVQAMQQEISQNSEVQFYLATDDPKEKAFMQAQFGSHIFTADIQYGRDSTEAIKDSLVELYVLSKMKKLIGSFESSFTQTASSYNGRKPYIVIK